MKNFSSLEEEVQQMIVERCCVKQVDENVYICQNHEEVLGKQFMKKINPNRICMWPSHSTKVRANKNLRNPFPSQSGDDKKQSCYLYSKCGIVLPFQSKVCLNCKGDCSKRLEGFEEHKVRSPVIQRRAIEIDFHEESSPSLTSLLLLKQHLKPTYTKTVFPILHFIFPLSLI